jgi:hypothetical protein
MNCRTWGTATSQFSGEHGLRTSFLGRAVKRPSRRVRIEHRFEVLRPVLGLNAIGQFRDRGLHEGHHGQVFGLQPALDGMWVNTRGGRGKPGPRFSGSEPCCAATGAALNADNDKHRTRKTRGRPASSSLPSSLPGGSTDERPASHAAGRFLWIFIAARFDPSEGRRLSSSILAGLIRRLTGAPAWSFVLGETRESVFEPESASRAGCERGRGGRRFQPPCPSCCAVAGLGVGFVADIISCGGGV